MKSARWLALVLIALGAAWFLARTRATTPKPETPSAVPSAPEVANKAAVESPAPPAVAAPVPEAAEAAALPQAEFAPPTIAPVAPVGVMLYGFVLPTAGAKALEPPVYLSLSDRYGENRRCEAGEDGAYSFPDLASGRYWIRAQAQLGGEARQVIELDAAAGDRRFDLQLERTHEIQVEVVDGAGEPIRDVWLTAVATLEPPGDWCEVYGSVNNPFGVGAWAQNGFGGRNFARTVLGCIRLQMPPPLFVSVLHNQRVVGTQRVELGQELVRFVLDPASPLLQKGRLSLRLVDAPTQQPLAGVSLHVAYGAMAMSGVTGLDGTYSTSVLPGWVMLRSLGGSHENPELRVRVEAGSETELGDIALAEEVSISGQVVDAQGNGVARRIDYAPIDPLTGRAIRSGVRYAVNSSADGNFRVSGLARRRYRASVDVSDSEFGSAALLVDARAGSVQDVRIELVPGTALFLGNADGRWSQISFDILDSQSTPLISSRLWGPEPRKILLAPGRYAIDVRAGEKGEAVRREFTIGTEPVELSLP